jgi:hypothetical protein
VGEKSIRFVLAFARFQPESGVGHPLAGRWHHIHCIGIQSSRRGFPPGSRSNPRRIGAGEVLCSEVRATESVHDSAIAMAFTAVVWPDVIVHVGAVLEVVFSSDAAARLDEKLKLASV